MLLRSKGEKEEKYLKTEITLNKLKQEIWKKVQSWGERENELIKTHVCEEAVRKKKLVSGLSEWVLVISEIVLTGKGGMRDAEKWKKMDDIIGSLGYSR